MKLAGFVMVGVLGLLVWGGGCGSGSSGNDGGGGGSCTSVQGSCTVAAGCIEYANYPSTAGAQTACTQNGGTFSSSACSRSGAVGGCRQMVSSLCNTTWYYTSSGLSAAQVQAACSASGTTFVSP